MAARQAARDIREEAQARGARGCEKSGNGAKEQQRRTRAEEEAARAKLPRNFSRVVAPAYLPAFIPPCNPASITPSFFVLPPPSIPPLFLPLSPLLSLELLACTFLSPPFSRCWRVHISLLSGRHGTETTLAAAHRAIPSRSGPAGRIASPP